MATRKDQLFSQAEKTWDLKRLYTDLAKAKGKELTPGEKVHLRGLLCGCSPAELAEQLNKNLSGVEADLCSTVYSYVKKLLNKPSVDNWRNISEWLEGTGYRMVVASISQQMGSVKLPVENLEASVRIISQQSQQFYINNQYNPTFQIHFHSVVTVSQEELKKLLLEAGLTVVEHQVGGEKER